MNNNREFLVAIITIITLALLVSIIPNLSTISVIEGDVTQTATSSQNSLQDVWIESFWGEKKQFVIDLKEFEYVDVLFDYRITYSTNIFNQIEVLEIENLGSPTSPISKELNEVKELTPEQQKWFDKYQRTGTFIELTGKITNARIKFEGAWNQLNIDKYEGFAFFLPFDGFISTAKSINATTIYTDYTVNAETYYFWFYVEGGIWAQFNENDVLVYTSNQLLEVPQGERDE